jgi:hypothetical protein
VSRKQLLELLLDHSWRLSELAREFDTSVRTINEDLRHLSKSLKRLPYGMEVEPATCRKCGFVFAATKLTKPSKCPQCRNTWIVEPVVRLYHKTGHTPQTTSGR